MFKPKKKKKVKPICGNCILFDPKRKECNVFVLFNGEKLKPPVDANDKCLYLNLPVNIPEKGEKFENINDEIKQVKWWVEDPITGEKKDGDGKVKIEYPIGFFGDEKLGDKLSK